MTTKAVSFCVVLFTLVFSGAGCATIITHGGPGSKDLADLPQGVYRGIRLDACFVFAPPGSDEPGVFRVLFAVDIPFCAAADTIVLPYDLATLGNTNCVTTQQ